MRISINAKIAMWMVMLVITLVMVGMFQITDREPTVYYHPSGYARYVVDTNTCVINMDPKILMTNELYIWCTLKEDQ